MPATPATQRAPQSFTAQPQPPVQAPVRSGWAVQLASLQNGDSARGLANKLREEGFEAYLRVSGRTHRVFVGPIDSRQEASRIRDQLEIEQRLDGFVVNFEPMKN
ncbi:SPOR domain-containing protein [Stutzerimonas xanthomarina]|nr:SPOR domain-containing protein [Stutzerimonas stutzeri]MDX2352447.1 SPOR domain-containing protein [Stutzerimonas xanthomarina]